MTHRKDYTGIGIPRPTGKQKDTDGITVKYLPEKNLQSLCEQYLTLIGLDFLHIPAQTLNAAFGWRTMTGPQLGAARKASDAIKGVPDLLIFFRGQFLPVELKTPIGKMGPHQLKWQKRLGTIVCRRFEDFCKAVEMWKLEIELRAEAKQ